jgi:hypothetical protein
MGVELSQWTLVKPGRPGEPRRAADDAIWLKAPNGEIELLHLARLAPEVRAVVAELASGSKVPKEIVGDILAARAAGGSVGEPFAPRPWTFHHLDDAAGLYVVLSPPPERGARPVAFSLTALQPRMRLQLELASPGDPVAEDVVAALRGDAAPGSPERGDGAVADRAARRR